jgi:signal transduction histidine kinase
MVHYTDTMEKLQALNLQIEAASTAKSQFLANMSHEFRTPLNAIIGFTEVLQDQIPGPLNAEQIEYLGDVHNAGQLLLRLINDVLDLAKVEAGRLELFYETFPIAQTVREAVTALRGAAEKKGITIQLNLPPDLGLITADQIRLKQILFNLLSNAVKFTDHGGVRVTAAIEDSQLHLAIADTGIGIRPEDMQRIFVEFSQVDASHARRHEGTGLGLALSKRLVEAHGGRIWLESRFGEGSVFHVLLPLRPPDGNKQQPGSPALESSNG